MKYNVGDRVRIKSLDWYNENKDENGNIVFSSKVTHFSWRENVRTVFTKDMAKFCGKVVTIEIVWTVNYSIVEGTHRDYFTDEMIEGLVEDESIIDLTVKGEEIKERIEITLPEGYEYVIESGKIIFTKKKKEYPKTYEECCRVLGVSEFEYNHTGTKMWYRHKLMATLDNLMLCRDAYWKLYGEENGLGKPWEPDWNNEKQDKYGFHGEVKYTIINSAIFVFPTAEMRDVFYENFKREIEICKGLL